jgi:hypothetical protein
VALARTNLANNQAASVASLNIASVTVSTGDLLVVAIGTTTFGTAETVSGVTWNGNALTKAVSKNQATGAQAQWHEVSIWYLKIAAGATATVAITLTGTCDDLLAQAVKYTGHDTTTPIGDTDSTFLDNAGGVEPSLTLTTASGDEVLDVLQIEDTANLTEGAGQTSIYEAATSNNFGTIHVSAEAATGTSVTMSWTRALDRGYDYCAAVIKAAAGGGATQGTVSVVVDGLSVSSVGTEKIPGAAAVVVDGLAASMSGRERLRGTAAAVVDGLSFVGSGAERVRGAAAVAVDGLSLSAVGAERIAGVPGVVVDGLSTALAGVERIRGAASVTVDGIAVSGTDGGTIAGVGAIVVDGLSVAAVGRERVRGAGAIVVDGLAFSGTDSGAIQGSAAIVVDGLALVAIGRARIVGAGASVVDGIAAAASGAQRITGLAALSIDGLAIVAVGSERIRGLAAIPVDGLGFAGAEIAPTVYGRGTYSGASTRRHRAAGGQARRNAMSGAQGRLGFYDGGAA